VATFPGRRSQSNRVLRGRREPSNYAVQRTAARAADCKRYTYKEALRCERSTK